MKGFVYFNNIYAGVLEKKNSNYIFEYDRNYLNNTQAKSISLSLPKSKKKFRSRNLFPFFYGLLAEGIISKIQCQKLKIDKDDYFTRLIKTAGKDTIGSITIREQK